MLTSGRLAEKRWRKILKRRDLHHRFVQHVSRMKKKRIAAVTSLTDWLFHRRKRSLKPVSAKAAPL